MIHGMWSDAGIWDNYREFFGERGFQVSATTLRHHDQGPEAPPPPELGATSLLDYLDDLEAELAAYEAPPIIMGHSMGGLLTQMLAARGRAAAAVLLNPASPAGINPIRPTVLWTFLRPLSKWGFWYKPHRLTFREARFSMLNVMPEEQARAAHAGMVWESGRAASEIAYWWADPKKASRVDPAAVRCPVLTIAGGRDRITPLPVERATAARYQATGTYREFPEHSHWTLGEPGWRDVAGACADWLEQLPPADAEVSN